MREATIESGFSDGFDGIAPRSDNPLYLDEYLRGAHVATMLSLEIARETEVSRED